MEPVPVVAELTFPEGPRWHDGSLWYSDMHADEVHRWTPGAAPEVVARVPGRPSGLGWLPGGSLLVVSMLNHAVLRVDGPALEAHADLSRFVEHDCNDMVVTADGFAYVGNFGFDLHGKEEARPTSLLGIAPDGSVRVAADELSFPNGMVVLPTDGRLVVAESYSHCLTAFTIGPDGSLSDREEWADLGDAGPDGIAVDGEGCVWVADALGRAAIRIAHGGEVLARIPFPERIPVACCLGGDDGRSLYVCTSRHLAPEKCRATRSGQIEEVRVEVAAQTAA